jgi:DNA transformation protein
MHFILDKYLNHIGPIKAKKMFGAIGVWYQNAMFAVIASNKAYFRVDEYNRKDFKDCDPLTYESRGKIIELPYLELPKEILDSKELEKWALKATQAALRAKLKSTRRKRKNEHDHKEN